MIEPCGYPSLVKRVWVSATESHFEGTVSKEISDEHRQSTAQIELVKITQDAVFPRLVVRFLDVEKYSDCVPLIGKRFANIGFKLHKMVCGASIFAKTALDIAYESIAFQVLH